MKSNKVRLGQTKQGKKVMIVLPLPYGEDKWVRICKDCGRQYFALVESSRFCMRCARERQINQRVTSKYEDYVLE